MELEADALFLIQKEHALRLQDCPIRQTCVCCGALLRGRTFGHHGVEFFECSRCSHVQTARLPCVKGLGRRFDEIYPALQGPAYASRGRRVYLPKLDWILETLAGRGYDGGRCRNMRWLEIGSGAGYFLSVAREHGIHNIIGLEADPKLVDLTREHNADVEVVQWGFTFERALEEFDAEIVCSFFVLEHLDELVGVWDAMRGRPRGTIFAFAVPLFGFSCLLEQLSPDSYARNLDGMVHTHVFTELSLEYGLRSAECEIIGEWLFGQDAQDLGRVLRRVGDQGFHESVVRAALMSQLADAGDEVQGALDRGRLADQRHVVAVKV